MVPAALVPPEASGTGTVSACAAWLKAPRTMGARPAAPPAPGETMAVTVRVCGGVADAQQQRDPRVPAAARGYKAPAHSSKNPRCPQQIFPNVTS